MTGALLIDKPSGPTSHDIVAFTRRLLKTPRVGHTGTLDPLATGLLVLLVGHATRLSQFLVTDEKEYIADVRLGIATPTYDAQSLDDSRSEVRGSRGVTEAQVEAALPDFLGTFPQLPPPYSAKKVQGVRAYERARRNETVDLKPVHVTVYELELLSFAPRTSHLAPPASHLAPPASHLAPPASPLAPPASPLAPRTSPLAPPASPLESGGLVRLRVAASAGFYVRSLAHDLGQALGCGAHLEGLRRTRAGRFRIEEAATLDELQAAGPAAAGRLIPVNSLLSDLPAVTPTEEGLRRATHGNSLGPQHVQAGFPRQGPGLRVRVLQASGEVLAVAETRADGLLHPLVVLR